MTSKSSNVFKLPTAQESAQRTERRASAFMDAEPDINELVRTADLALHVHLSEMEGHKFSEAGSPLQTLLESVQKLAHQIRHRFYDADR
jgi:hypothetical protein